MRLFAAACTALAMTASAFAPAWAQDVFAVEVVERYPHDTGAFTQGLFFHQGQLYESTGQVGESSIRRVDLESGEVEAITAVPPPYFGEGSTVWGDKIIMVSWRLGGGFVFDLETLEQIDDFTIFGEGWGLTHDGEKLILSDGTSRLRYLDPENYNEIGHLDVTWRGQPIGNLNELEFIDGEIWANVWGDIAILRIDPETGEATSALNLAPLVREAGFFGHRDHVLNGIAYDEATGRIFVTGKRWPVLFEIEVVEP